MALQRSNLMIDCGDVMVMAGFWAEALGYVIAEDSDASGAYISDGSDPGTEIFFQPVPEPKTAKNRIHLDLRPTGSMEEEVERLKTLGATVRGFIEADDSYWTQMRDPEGNEFCVLRGPDDGWMGEANL